MLAVPAALGSPVISSRQWTTALAPGSSGWDFICQSYQSGEAVPSEWIVINLNTGVVAITLGPNEIYSNSNFQIDSENTLVTDNNQLRASGGRIFFPQRYGRVGVDVTDQHYVNVAYFDPATRVVAQIPSVLAPGGTRHALAFSATFNVAGSLIYFGSQAVVGDLPFIFTVNPSTLATNVIGAVGAAASVNVKYAYYLAKDEGPGAALLYVAVGQDPWELISINVSTGVQTTLYTTAGPGVQGISFTNQVGLGWRVTIYDNGVATNYWVADGAITAYPGGGAPTGGARTVTPYVNALVSPPEIDWSNGIGQVQWRANGSSGPYTQIDYDVVYEAPVPIESLIALSDGTTLGNAEQYNGVFRGSSATGLLTWYGAWPLGLSQPVMLEVSPTVVYMAGYPNGALFRYNPTASWNPEGAPAPANPLSLGSFHATSGVKYSYFLEVGANGRLYQSGRRERDSSGSGIGYYDPVGLTFAGTTAAPLDNYIPRGMVVMDGISRVVFSGETLDASDAKLCVYSLDLTLLNQYTVQAGIRNTGLLFETLEPNIIVGLTNDSPYYLYRFNVSTGTLLSITTLGAAITGSTQRAFDLSIWVMVGNNLKRIDTNTMEVTTVRDLTAVVPVGYLAWTGNSLYLGTTGALQGAASTTAPTGHMDPFTAVAAPAGTGHLSPT